MKRYLSLDVGMRRTGIAFSESGMDFSVSLETISHGNSRELSDKLLQIIQEKHITDIVVGLPLLLSGKQGEQVTIVKDTIEECDFSDEITIHYIDERYSSYTERNIDDNAAAAIEILNTFLSIQKKV